MAQRGVPAAGAVDVLVVVYGGGHVQAVVPVAKALQARGVRVCVLALTTAIAVLAATDLPYFTYADLPEAAEPETQAVAARLMRDMPQNGVLPASETAAYLGLNYRDLEESLGPAAAAEAWAHGGRQHFHPRRLMRSVLSRIAPRFVLTTNSPRSEQAAIEVAGELGIASACLVDLFALHAVRWIAQPTFARRIYVLDESVKAMFLRHGRPEADIRVTGNPAFDSLHDPQVKAAAVAMRAARGWGQGGRTTLLYASTPEPKLHPYTGLPADPDLPRALERHLVAMVAADPRLELVIRRHPSEDQEIATGPRIHASPRADDVNALVQAVDLVVVTASTVGLQAYLAGTQMLSVERSVFAKDAPYGDFGMSVPVPDLPDIAPAVERLLPRLQERRTRPSEPPLRQTATEAIVEDVLGWLG